MHNMYLVIVVYFYGYSYGSVRFEDSNWEIRIFLFFYTKITLLRIIVFYFFNFFFVRFSR